MKHAWKATVIGLLMTLLAGGMAVAQASTTAVRPEPGSARLERLREKLDLNDAQVAQLRPIMADWAQQMKARRQAYRAELKKVLTPAQLAKLEQRRAACCEARKQGQKPGVKGQLARALGLSNDQVATLRAYRQEMAPQVKAQRQQHLAQVTSVLTPEQAKKFASMVHHRRRGGRRHPAGEATPQS